MTPPPASNDVLQRIRRIAQAAGEILLRYYKKEFSVSYKTDKFDPVTDADLAADAFIKRELAAAFPEDQLLTEESGASGQLDYSRRVWVIDPLDGTKYFVRGLEQFSVSIGLLEGGRPVLGVVHLPVSSVTYAASARGAWKEWPGGSQPLTVSSTTRLQGCTNVARMQLGETKPFDELVDAFTASVHARSIIGTGAAMKICLVAEGVADLLVNASTDAKKWDTCAAQCILEAAGGRLTRFDGSPLDYTQDSPVWDESFLASNGFLHDALVAELRALRDGTTTTSSS